MIRIFRIATLIVAVASPAAAQIADVSLLSPTRLTGESWIPRPAVTVAQVAQEVPAAPAPAAVPATAPAAVPAVAPDVAPAVIQALAPIALPELQQPAEPSGPALRRAVTVTGEIVRIGDLVENAGAVADVPIFRAPDLGQTGSVPAARVLDAIRSHHIISLDTRGLDEVLVTRASRVINAKEVEARILRALAGQYGVVESKDLSANFDNEVRTFHIEPAAELGIARLSYDKQTRRFDVTLDLPTSTARRVALRATGTLVETGEAVVTLRAVAQGEVLKASDVMIERRPKTDVISIEEVIGFAAKRALKSGQLIRAADVIKPELVARNETVTIVFEAPGMMLSIRGTALEAGARGDVINVLNVQSKRTIQGTVSDRGRVTVTAAMPRVVAATEQANPPR
jgi:flagella basal body P-ring formation protein FlgA